MYIVQEEDIEIYLTGNKTDYSWSDGNKSRAFEIAIINNTNETISIDGIVKVNGWTVKARKSGGTVAPHSKQKGKIDIVYTEAVNSWNGVTDCLIDLIVTDSSNNQLYRKEVHIAK